jgi:hypothetical protein
MLAILQLPEAPPGLVTVTVTPPEAVVPSFLTATFIVLGVQDEASDTMLKTTAVLAVKTPLI